MSLQGSSRLLVVNSPIWYSKMSLCCAEVQNATKFLFLMSAGTFMQAKDGHFVLNPIVHLCCWLSGARVERCEFLISENLKPQLCGCLKSLRDWLTPPRFVAVQEASTPVKFDELICGLYSCRLKALATAD